MAGAASAAHAEVGTTAGAAVVRAHLIDVRDRVLLHTAGGSPYHPAIIALSSVAMSAAYSLCSCISQHHAQPLHFVASCTALGGSRS